MGLTSTFQHVVQKPDGDDEVLLNNNNVRLSCAHQRPERSHDTY